MLFATMPSYWREREKLAECELETRASYISRGLLQSLNYRMILLHAMRPRRPRKKHVGARSSLLRSAAPRSWLQTTD
eukprot:scaffold3881_cov255-Pinguiococcus_pyrenoidosus.AAC.4